MKIEEGIGEKASIFLFYFSTFVAGDVFALILGWELALICLISFPLSSLSMAFITWVRAIRMGTSYRIFFFQNTNLTQLPQ